MTPVEILFDLYIDMNMLLLLAALGWSTVLAVLKHTRLEHCHETLLRGSYLLFAFVIALPVLLFFVERTGAAAPVLSMVSLSDFAVAQFLDGRIEMSPMAFEYTLGLRSEIVRDAATFEGVIGQSLAVLVLAGLSLGAWRLCGDLRKVRQFRRDSYLLRRCGRVHILISETATVPFSTRGLWRHYAIIPTEFLIRPGDLRIAVSHELQHIRQGDVTWEVLLELLRPVFFWNPAFYFLKYEVEHRRELVCDHQVLTRQRASAADYADCLLRACERMLEVRSGTNRLPTPSVPFAAWPKAGARRGLVTRFESLCQPTQVRAGALPKILLATLMFFVLVSSGAMHASSDWSHDRIMLSSIVNLERLNSRTIAEVAW